MRDLHATSSTRKDRDSAVGQLIAELTGIAQSPAHVDFEVLDRLNTAFGRVRDTAPEVYQSDPAVAGFHFQTDYFADTTSDTSTLLDMFTDPDTDGGGS